MKEFCVLAHRCGGAREKIIGSSWVLGNRAIGVQSAPGHDVRSSEEGPRTMRGVAE